MSPGLLSACDPSCVQASHDVLDKRGASNGGLNRKACSVSWRRSSPHMILILFGVGVVAQVVAASSATTTASPGPGARRGPRVYVSAAISGGHINPAVTFAFAAFGDFRGARCCPTHWRQTAGGSSPPCWCGGTTARCWRRRTRATRSRRRGVLHPAGQRDAPVSGPGRAARPDHRHGHPVVRRGRARSTCATSRPGGQHGAVRDRAAGGGDRHGLGHQRRLRDQPGARLRPRLAPTSPGYSTRSTTSTATSTSGCRSSAAGRRSHRVWLYKVLVGRFMPPAEPEPAAPSLHQPLEKA